MMRALDELNAEGALGAQPLQVGIGLHVGDALAGSIGSSKKLEFTVIGDTINVAARLEATTKIYGATIIASRALVDGAGASCVARQLDRAVVRGRAESTEILEILDPDDPRAARVPTWERAMDDYLAMRWNEAITGFEEASAGLDDPVFQIARCRRLAAEAPDPGWTGVAHLAS